MTEIMHFAAQYLAAAGISFIEKKADDSHTNLGFSVRNQQLETHPLSINGDILCLNYNTFSLDWSSSKFSASFFLENKTHVQALEWLHNSAKIFLGKEYKYQFHYALPNVIDDSFTYELNISELSELASLRTVAQSTILETLRELNLKSEVRVWPHHFDTGAFASLNSELDLGLGMAIPDEVVNEHYFYISGYKDGKSIETNSLEMLTEGEWKNNGFKGAVLPVKKAKKDKAIQFFTSVVKEYEKDRELC
ncbi:hypothetical protein M4I21_10360 [Cellulophaga sp. 20_2_10]|uniref:hypothetical protein n=1 Tax=Cellulophaga sp. 20_2_10 TaxID=2942476 RepID=UPI00201B2B4D|nr:hypothetical protein [Cellulophaga sp. 20_2_10]MCL5246211.1 hypothetical protein [Cellulophaga sp. 20_2_10]